MTIAIRLALLTLLAAGPAEGLAQQQVNPMHPLFAPLDAAGKLVVRSEDVSADATCGACHDARFIASHGEHGEHGLARAQATCLECHVDGGRLDVSHLEGGKLRREDARIGRPQTANCATCHGVISDGAAPVVIPRDFEALPETGKSFTLTRGGGAVFAPQRMSDSFMNLQGKAGLHAPWDAHAAKLVDCVACHYARNDPRHGDLKETTLRYLTSDPRRPSTADFLLRPDHELAKAGCRSCHAALSVHDFLPYRERHMQVLSCTACHAPGPMAPTAEMIDATVSTAAGTPVIRWRNVERRPGEPLNAAPIRPLRPLFVFRTESDGVRRLAPVNVVSRWRWVSGADRAEIPFATVVRAFRDEGRWTPQVLRALDVNGDGTLSEAELRLDAPSKVAAVEARLRELGVLDPHIDGVMEVHPLAHGLAGRDNALRDCGACHGEDSRLSGDYALAAYVPGGLPPRPPDGGTRVELTGTVGPAAGGGLVFRRDPDALPGGLHVLGRSRQAATNAAGFAIFALVFAGVVIHGAVRLALRRRRPGAASAVRLEPVYAFGRYERLWHWTMAISGLVLVLTGLEIHAGMRAPFGLATTVSLHNAFAVVLIVNASLSLFYHVATATIRTFIPTPHGLLARVLEHLEYQTRGIFRGGPHPGQPPGQKLNPLQQISYLVLLNLLFPLQIATGAGIWAVGHWTSVAAALGGLSVMAPLHNLGGWLFLSFFTLHVYLVSTGRTLGEHLKGMITGYQMVEPDPSEPQGA